MIPLPLSAQERQRRLRLYEQGLSDAEVAAILGIQRKTIRKWRYRNGVPANPQRYPFRAERDRQYKSCYQHGLNDTESARILNVSPSTVTAWRNRKQLPSNARRERKGPITKSENQERMRLYEEGKTDAELAQIIGIDPSTVSQWRRRRNLPPNKRRV